MSLSVLSDRDVERLFPMATAVEVMEDAFRHKAKGELLAPARLGVDMGSANLVFTAGARTGADPVVGFRVYDMCHLHSAERSEAVIVFDSDRGFLKGIVTGSRLGAVRTGAIGGVAIKFLSRPDSRQVGLIGSGVQAATQLEAAVVVRKLERVKVYSPNASHRESFCHRMQATLELPVEPVDTAEEAVGGADILICATTAKEPVFRPEWCKAGVHIQNVGPKFKKAHEVVLPLAERSRLLVTDAPAQVEAYGEEFILHGTPLADRLVELSEVVVGTAPGRASPEDISIFYSLGLAGTEVLAACAMFERADRQ